MKKMYITFIIVICFMLCGISAANAKEKDIKQVMEVDVTGANIKLKKGKSDSIVMKYYGMASDENYNLTTATDGNQYKISLKYTGNHLAPAIKKGGVIVKIPEHRFSLLKINGTSGAGIVLNKITIDTDLKTSDCAVIINNKDSSHKISIHSNHDVYEIKSVPMSVDFVLQSVGSVVEYVFTQQPTNLKFKLTGGYAELPAGWSRNFVIGSRQPKMTVDVDQGIFELSIDR